MKRSLFSPKHIGVYRLLIEHSSWGQPDGGRVFTREECKALVAMIEEAFNAGFDAGVKAVTPTEVLRSVKFDHPRYVSDRRKHFAELMAELT